ncbi:hypothetical protein HYZ80_03905 [Candidatus Parcubacteria bacterium]|nr:hypothetical protein [Candidatus Parcubacteria bacterium]
MGLILKGSGHAVRCDDPHRKGCRQETTPRWGPLAAEKQAGQVGWRFDSRADTWSCADCRRLGSSISEVAPSGHEEGVGLAAEILGAVVAAPELSSPSPEKPGGQFGGGETGAGGVGGAWDEEVPPVSDVGSDTGGANTASE